MAEINTVERFETHHMKLTVSKYYRLPVRFIKKNGKVIVLKRVWKSKYKLLLEEFTESKAQGFLNYM